MDCKKAQSLVTAYIMRKLNDKDLEDFLEHVDSCEECYEELEIYYTVHYTIARLDEDEADQVYNVKKALQNRLEESRFYIWRTKVYRIYRMGLMVLAELLLVVILMTQADLWQNGTMEHNPICQFLSIHREDRRQAETESKPGETESETKNPLIKTDTASTENETTTQKQREKKQSKNRKKKKKKKKSKKSKKKKKKQTEKTTEK